MNEVYVACSIMIILISLFVLMGIMLSRGKWSFLIAGYNTSSKEEKQQYDEIALCKFMGKFMLVIAFCIFLFLLSEVLKIRVLLDLGVILLYVSIIFLLIYSNTGNRFKRKR